MLLLTDEIPAGWLGKFYSPPCCVRLNLGTKKGTHLLASRDGHLEEAHNTDTCLCAPVGARAPAGTEVLYYRRSSCEIFEVSSRTAAILREIGYSCIRCGQSSEVWLAGWFGWRKPAGGGRKVFRGQKTEDRGRLSMADLVVCDGKRVHAHGWGGEWLLLLGHDAGDGQSVAATVNGEVSFVDCDEFCARVLLREHDKRGVGKVHFVNSRGLHGWINRFRLCL